MYTDHFRLAGEPFGITPDPACVYLGPEHREALAALRYGLLERRGFITLIGEVGTGKTTLLYTLLSNLGPDVKAAYVAYTAQPFVDLLAAALKDFGVEPGGLSKRELLGALNALLLEQEQRGLTTALLIDEAQNLSDEAFEELRLLSNFETYERKLLQIVLVGQPELWERLSRPHLRQLRERVTVRARIDPLTSREVRRYVEHRLQRVGGTTCTLFSPCAMRVIVARSRGIPRRVNNLCHNALLFAYGCGVGRVTAGMAREVQSEMNESPRGRRSVRLARRLLRSRRAALRWAGAAAIAVVGAALWLPGRPHFVSPAGSTATTVEEMVGPPLAGAKVEKETTDVLPLWPHERDAAAMATMANYELESLAWRRNGVGEQTQPAAARHARRRARPPIESVRRRSRGQVSAVVAKASSPDRGDVGNPGTHRPEQAAAPSSGKAVASPSAVVESQEQRRSPAPPAPGQDRRPGRAPARVTVVSQERTDDVVIKRVPAGATVYSIGREVYAARGEQFDAQEFLSAVRRFNPSIGNLNRIAAGQVIRLPASLVMASASVGGAHRE